MGFEKSNLVYLCDAQRLCTERDRFKWRRLRLLKNSSLSAVIFSKGRKTLIYFALMKMDRPCIESSQSLVKMSKFYHDICAKSAQIL